MAYNYYYTGHINLTASLDYFVHGSNESVLSRFLAYIFDLNYGILPYFTVVLLLSLIFLVKAVIRKNYRYIEWFLTFVVLVVLYSFMIHINCGMFGIARYNTWSMPLLFFAVLLIGPESLSGIKMKKACLAGLAAGIGLTASIVYWYGPYYASNTSYLTFTPIARWALDHVPAVYNPLKSTFNSRTMHVDGGYQYETPVVYTARDGMVRKILAAEKDKEILLESYASIYGSDDHFIDQINRLKGEGYISLNAKDGIVSIDFVRVGR